MSLDILCWANLPSQQPWDTWDGLADDDDDDDDDDGAGAGAGGAGGDDDQTMFNHCQKKKNSSRFHVIWEDDWNSHRNSLHPEVPSASPHGGPGAAPPPVFEGSPSQCLWPKAGPMGHWATNMSHEKPWGNGWFQWHFNGIANSPLFVGSAKWWWYMMVVGLKVNDHYRILLINGITWDN